MTSSSGNFLLWIGILLIVVGVIVFVFMYTLNKKSEVVTPEVDKKLLINDAINIVSKPLSPSVFTPFFNLIDNENNLYDISYYKIGDTPIIEQLSPVTNPTLFIIKYDDNKNVLYTKTITTLNSDLNLNSTLSACIDADNNLFIVAEYNSDHSITIDSVTLPQTNDGDRNFVLKLDPNGTAVVGKAITELNTADIEINSLNMLENNVVICGLYRSNSTINLGSFSLPDTTDNNTGFLIGFFNNLIDYSFVNTLNVIENFTSNIRNFVYNDETSILTVIGSYTTNSVVNLGNGITLPSTSNISSVFLLQYTYSNPGTLTINKSKSLINNNAAVHSNIVQDSTYNIYFMFKYNGDSINVDSITLPSVTEYTNLLLKLDSSLVVNNVSLSNTIDSGGQGGFLTLDLKNNLYFINTYTNNSSVNLGLNKVLPPATETFPSAGLSNVVILKYNSKLSLIDFAYVAGTSYNQNICVNHNFNVYANILFISESQNVDLGNNVVLTPTDSNARYITLEYIPV